MINRSIKPSDTIKAERVCVCVCLSFWALKETSVENSVLFVQNQFRTKVVRLYLQRNIVTQKNL